MAPVCVTRGGGGKPKSGSDRPRTQPDGDARRCGGWGVGEGERWGRGRGPRGLGRGRGRNCEAARVGPAVGRGGGGLGRAWGNHTLGPRDPQPAPLPAEADAWCGRGGACAPRQGVLRRRRVTNWGIRPDFVRPASGLDTCDARSRKVPMRRTRTLMYICPDALGSGSRSNSNHLSQPLALSKPSHWPNQGTQ